MAYIRGEVYAYVDFDGLIHAYTPTEHLLTQDGHEAVEFIIKSTLNNPDLTTAPIMLGVMKGVLDIIADIKRWGPDTRKWYANVRENTKIYTRSEIDPLDRCNWE